MLPGDLKIRTPYSLAETGQQHQTELQLFGVATAERICRVKYLEAASGHIQESEFVETNRTIKNKVCEHSRVLIGGRKWLICKAVTA